MTGIKERRESIKTMLKDISKMLNVTPLLWENRSSDYSYNHTIKLSKVYKKNGKEILDKKGKKQYIDSGSYFMGGTGRYYKFPTFEAYVRGIYEGLITKKYKKRL